MPTFQISVANDKFAATGEQELPNFGAAQENAISSALQMGAEQIVAGAPFFGAEVTVSDERNQQRFIVALGVTSLK